jgi:hypothetical protein
MYQFSPKRLSFKLKDAELQKLKQNEMTSHSFGLRKFIKSGSTQKIQLFASQFRG